MYIGNGSVLLSALLVIGAGSWAWGQTYGFRTIDVRPAASSVTVNDGAGELVRPYSVTGFCRTSFTGFLKGYHLSVNTHSTTDCIPIVIGAWVLASVLVGLFLGAVFRNAAEWGRAEQGYLALLEKMSLDACSSGKHPGRQEPSEMPGLQSLATEGVGASRRLARVTHLCSVEVTHHREQHLERDSE